MLIVLMGGCSVGKDKLEGIINKEFNIPICVSSTTRPMRENEQNGREYRFISKDKFIEDDKIGKFVEHRIYHTAEGDWYYGLSKDSVDINTNQLVIVDQSGYYSLVKEFGQDNVLGIYLFASERVKIQRALSRETRTDKKFFLEFYRRMADDLIAFDNCQKDKNVTQIENIDLAYTIFMIAKILKSKGVIS